MKPPTEIPNAIILVRSELCEHGCRTLLIGLLVVPCLGATACMPDSGVHAVVGHEAACTHASEKDTNWLPLHSYETQLLDEGKGFQRSFLHCDACIREFN